MKRVAGAVVLSAIMAAAANAAAQSATGSGMRVDSVFARWSSSDSPGCATAISQNGALTLQRAYGMSDLEHDIPNTPSTVFEAGSVSKQFTAAAVVMLALDGKLSLDDDVRKHIPELPDYGTRINIRHLLTHTSGLRDWGSVAGIGGWPRTTRVHTHAHVLDILSRQRALNFTPGEQYSYSNSGYNLLAVVVERVSGVSFAEFSKRNIFVPLGMANTQWRDDFTRIVKNRSVAYEARAQGGFAMDMPFENVHGNGGLLTTVGDLLLFTQNLETGRIGGPRFVEAMHTRGIVNSGDTITYAAGLMIGSYAGTREVSHTGSTAGYRAFLASYPERELAVAVLCNVGNVNPGTVGHAVADVFLRGSGAAPVAAGGARAGGAGAGRSGTAGGRAGGATPPPYTPTAAELSQLAGEYYSPDAEATYWMEVANDRLVLRRRPDSRVALTAVSRDQFSGAGFTAIRFIRDQNGRVTQFSVRQERVFDLRFDRVR